MSVLTKGLAMDFVREGRKDMAITSIWPAVVCSRHQPPLYSFFVISYFYSFLSFGISKCAGLGSKN